MQIGQCRCQKKVNDNSLNMFYSLFCIFITVFWSAFSRAPTFISLIDFTDRLMMLFSAVPAKGGNNQ